MTTCLVTLWYVVRLTVQYVLPCNADNKEV